MPSPAERQRLKEKAQAQKAKLPVVSGLEPVTVNVKDNETVETWPDSEPTAIPPNLSGCQIKTAKRKCCDSFKGDSPHLPGCLTLLPKEAKHIGHALPGGRWPLGTVISKRWNGEMWNCSIEVPHIDQIFQGHATSTIRCEQKATELYLKWAEESAKKDVDVVTANG